MQEEERPHPTLKAPFPSEIVERFWIKVSKDGPIPAHCPELGPCWVWTASTRAKGYGAFGYHLYGVLVQDRAHRFSFVLHGGVLKAGMCVLHRCDNPPCVRPSHLFTGTKAENNRDMCRKGRHVSGGTYTTGKYKRDTDHHKAKLDPDKVRAIRAEYDPVSNPLSDLARKYGVASVTVRNVVERKRWKHVE